MKKAAIATVIVLYLFLIEVVVLLYIAPYVSTSTAEAETIPDIYDVVYVEPVVEEPVVEEVVEPEPVVEEVVEPEPQYVEPVTYEPYPEVEETPETYSGAVYEDGVYIEGVLTKSGGVNYYNGRRETWYSQRVLPGGGLDIPGRHVGSNGLIYDGDGYICVAADDLAYGTVVETSLGMGKVYDCGVGSNNAIDIYTDW